MFFGELKNNQPSSLSLHEKVDLLALIGLNSHILVARWQGSPAPLFSICIELKVISMYDFIESFKIQLICDYTDLLLKMTHLKHLKHVFVHADSSTSDPWVNVEPNLY